ncbi:MAG: hypothetical protein A3E82_08220 [Gammaproteobacteria bacterium RIFCSPHIGHO2_12_FULL_38_11]|nr:MAG: hypothetical protein A3E82_08220 [Gammaproteobacteria bacterium RIFCSPHIGHO2_12_FULL_38_11]
MYVKRHLALPHDHSVLLFGARGVGKSSLLEDEFKLDQNLYLDLLDPEIEMRFLEKPNDLIALVDAMPDSATHVIIDEIQKVPKLLDIVHLLIEKKKTKKIFILTGSSARKLKLAGVNLLAGRAFVYHLYPLTYLELGAHFKLDVALAWGLLPKAINLATATAKRKFLQSYALTYLKVEVWAEQLVKKLDSFRRFLQVAAQTNSKIVNYANIARNVGVDDKTVATYFEILEDTLLGFMLESYRHSFRKRLRHAPKFYFIDVGIVRALSKTLTIPLVRSTNYYDDLFEQFIVTECIKLASYNKSEYQFSYLRTESDVEVDLIVERPGKQLLLIEVKSKVCVEKSDLKSLINIASDFPECEAVCFSCDPYIKKIDDVMVYPWQEGIKKFFDDDL